MLTIQANASEQGSYQHLSIVFQDFTGQENTKFCFFSDLKYMWKYCAWISHWKFIT